MARLEGGTGIGAGVHGGRRGGGAPPPPPRARLPHPLLRWLVPDPRLPGGRRFDRQVMSTLARRIPWFLGAAYLLVLSYDIGVDPDGERDWSPAAFHFVAAAGPSMLPTIHPAGDVYLRDAVSHRLPGPLRREYRVGDVVVYRDPKGRMSIKRLVGLGGSSVQRHGEHAKRYEGEEDLGVREAPCPVPDVSSWDNFKKLNREGGQGIDKQNKADDIFRAIIVPRGHVWLEGDSPLHSVDSRQYGPVPISSLRGRIIARIWPLSKDRRPLLLSQERPSPVKEEELILNERYNLHEIKRSQNT